MRRLIVVGLSGLFLFALSILPICDSVLVSEAEAGVLLRNQRRITLRLRRLPRMRLATRYPTSSKVGGRTNPTLNGSGNKTLDSSRQIASRQKAEEEYFRAYQKWSQKQARVAKKNLEKERRQRQERIIALKKAREAKQREVRKVESIKQAPLNPWFSTATKKAEPGSNVLQLGGQENKAKDPRRRVPLLKQIWQAIFG